MKYAPPPVVTEIGLPIAARMLPRHIGVPGVSVHTDRTYALRPPSIPTSSVLPAAGVIRNTASGPFMIEPRHCDDIREVRPTVVPLRTPPVAGKRPGSAQV